MTLNISKILMHKILFQILCFVFNNVDAYIEENNENKYLVFGLTDKNKEVLENYTELWHGNKNEIEAI